MPLLAKLIIHVALLSYEPNECENADTLFLRELRAARTVLPIEWLQNHLWMTLQDQTGKELCVRCTWVKRFSMYGVLYQH